LRELLDSTLLTLFVSISSTLLVVSLTLPTGFYISRNVGNRGFLLALTMTPFALSPSAIGLLLLIFFVKNPLGSMINGLFNIVNDPKGIIVAQFFIGIPIGISYYTALFSSVPTSYDETAYVIGYRPLEYFYKIMVPMVRSEVLIGVLLIFTRVLGDFGASYIVGGGIRGKTVTLPIYIYLVQQLGETSVLAMVLSIYVLTMFAMASIIYRKIR